MHRDVTSPDVVPWSIHHVVETGSTNSDLVEMALAGAPDRTVVVADHQTAGRGRLERSWDAPWGTNLLASLLFRSVPPAGPHRLTQQVAVAALRACHRISHVRPQLKWPNDLVIDGAKLAGILAEARATEGNLDIVVVGIGLNLGWAPPGATCLGGVDRDEFLQALLGAFDEGSSVDEYRAELSTLGQLVRVETFDRTFDGIAESVSASGSLMVRVGSELLEMHVGDVVHLRAVT